MFLRNCWYVFGWTHDLERASGPIGRVIIGEPVVVWRNDAGALHAMEDRCAHRHAPLSHGRIEGDTLRCMYHGMAFNAEGRCIEMPLMPKCPDVQLRVYPVVDKNDWLWVWMGDPAQADEALIPDAHGIHDPVRPMQSNSIEYEANYQLVHDNLCDLSHVDFVHATTLQPATGARWSETSPRIQSSGRAIRFERWFEDAEQPGGGGQRVDTWSTYIFAVPGIFIMHGARYPAGTAAACDGKKPEGIAPLVQNIEQQAVTPISEKRTAYHYATGLVGNTAAMTADLSKRMGVVMAAFEEDREMIEAQQKIWDLTPQERPKLFTPQDKGPFLMRKLMEKLINEEQSIAANAGIQFQRRDLGAISTG